MGEHKEYIRVRVYVSLRRRRLSLRCYQVDKGVQRQTNPAVEGGGTRGGGPITCTRTCEHTCVRTRVESMCTYYVVVVVRTINSNLTLGKKTKFKQQRQTRSARRLGWGSSDDV